MALFHFRQLASWQEGHKLVLLIYSISEQLPKKETFGLCSQIERAVVSVTSNISEGFSRKTSKEKSQFYSIALSSLMEVENQLIICKDLSYISSESYNTALNQLVIVRRLLYGMRKRITTF